jgi:DNA-nicking Smr family endonuclease
VSQSRRYRVLTSEERRLWAQVARSVAPLSGRAPPEEPPDEAPAAPQPTAAPAPAPSPGPSPLAAAAPLPPLAPLERKTLTGLRRGTRSVDAAIDLHGMRQAEAHAALLAFLQRQQRLGHQVVLVITGKGAAASGEGAFGERGVLRRVVPHWLRLPELRRLVLGFEEAAAQHGGSGALYVRLRRARNGERHA